MYLGEENWLLSLSHTKVNFPYLWLLASWGCKSLTLMNANDPFWNSIKGHQLQIENSKLISQFFSISSNFQTLFQFQQDTKKHITLYTHNDHSHVLLANSRTDGLTRTSSLRRGGYSTEAGRGLWNQPLWCSEILARNKYARKKNYENNLFENLSSTQDITFW